MTTVQVPFAWEGSDSCQGPELLLPYLRERASAARAARCWQGGAAFVLSGIFRATSRAKVSILEGAEVTAAEDNEPSASAGNSKHNVGIVKSGDRRDRDVSWHLFFDLACWFFYVWILKNLISNWRQAGKSPATIEYQTSALSGPWDNENHVQRSARELRTAFTLHAPACLVWHNERTALISEHQAILCNRVHEAVSRCAHLWGALPDYLIGVAGGMYPHTPNKIKEEKSFLPFRIGICFYYTLQTSLMSFCLSKAFSNMTIHWCVFSLYRVYLKYICIDVCMWSK